MRAARPLLFGLGLLVLPAVGACNQLFGIEDANAVDGGALVDGGDAANDVRTDHASAQGDDGGSLAGSRLGLGPLVFAYAGTSVGVAATSPIPVTVERGVVTRWVYNSREYTEGSLSAVDVGGGDEIIWGRWAGGTLGDTNNTRSSVTVAPNGGIHWVVGTTPFGTFPSSGTVTYPLIGSTSPTTGDGRKMPGTVNGSASVTFTGGTGATIRLSLTITIPGDATYVVKTATSGPSPLVVTTPPLEKLPSLQDALKIPSHTGSVCSPISKCFPPPCEAPPPAADCPVWITGAFTGASYQRLALVVQLSPNESYGALASVTTVVVFGTP